MKKVFLAFTAAIAISTVFSCTNASAKDEKPTIGFSSYIVVSNNDLQGLIRNVNTQLTLNHFTLVGGISVSNGNFYQAMAK